jgi:Calcium/calmodulin dependent protein kinase II association domain
MSLDADRDEIFRLTQKLLMSATSGDWETYSKLCDASLTAFEPEAAGNLVDGLGFHQFYFKLPGDDKAPMPVQSTIVAPHIRMMGDVAIIAYVRLTQKVDSNRHPITVAMEETRVWQRTAAGWKHVHFHRSPTGR